MTVEGSKLAKSDDKVVYMSPDEGPFMCKHCEYYLLHGAKKSPCLKVKGEVEAEGCCNLFEKEK